MLHGKIKKGIVITRPVVPRITNELRMIIIDVPNTITVAAEVTITATAAIKGTVIIVVIGQS